MDDHDGLRALRDGLLDEPFVNLQRVDVGLDEHRLQSILGDGKDGSDESIGRHDDLVVRLHHPHLDVCSIDERQRIQPVGHSDAVTRADVPGILLLEGSCGLTLQIPSGAYHIVGSSSNLICILPVDCL